MNDPENETPASIWSHSPTTQSPFLLMFQLEHGPDPEDHQA